MPRNYQRTTARSAWSEEAMKRALREIAEKKLSIRRASRIYEIPYGTLQDRLRGRFEAKKISLGRKTVFTKEQESEFAKRILEMSNAFYGLTPLNIRQLVFEYAEVNNISHPFKKETGQCGKDWLYSFMRRHPELSIRKPEATSIHRVTAFNRDELKIFYNNLAYLYDRFKFESHQIFNVDETGVTNVHIPSKILTAKGRKRVGAITSGERGQTVTLVCALSASGQYIPPMFIFKRNRMKEGLDRNGPVGAIYRCSKSGWITEELFLEWLKHFKKNVNSSKDHPVLLVLDNHSTHSSLASYNFCRESGIHLVSLPPHTSHRLQPLDITFFGPFKTAYYQECDKYMKHKKYEKISTADIAELVRNAFNRTAAIEKAVNGFKAAGIVPFNPDVFSAEELIVLPTDNDGRDETFDPSERHQSTSPIPAPSEEIGRPGPSGLGNRKRKTKSPSSECTSSESELEEVSDLELHDCEDKLVEPKNKKSLDISFKQLCPIPSYGLPKMTRSRTQHSCIMTSTSMRNNLENKELKKQKKKEVENVKRNIGAIKKNVRKNVVKKSSENARGKESPNNEVCAVCSQYGSNELWWRCRLCGVWSHADCTEADCASKYICAICSN